MRVYVNMHLCVYVYTHMKPKVHAHNYIYIPTCCCPCCWSAVRVTGCIYICACTFVHMHTHIDIDELPFLMPPRSCPNSRIILDGPRQAVRRICTIICCIPSNWWCTLPGKAWKHHFLQEAIHCNTYRSSSRFLGGYPT